MPRKQGRFRFAALGSGSKGNSLVVQDSQGTAVLVDCGLGIRHVKRRLRELDLALDDLAAVFVTHEHTDHCGGLDSLLRAIPLPVYMTWGTARRGGYQSLPNLQYLQDAVPITIDSLRITPVTVPHDSVEPCQFVIEQPGPARAVKFGVLTDLGSYTPHIISSYADCDALVLECNHDVAMLDNGSYPASIKRRIRGDWGHLSNAQAADFLQYIRPEKLQRLVVAHVSEQNNCIDLALEAIGARFRHPERITVASQDHGFNWLTVG